MEFEEICKIDVSDKTEKRIGDNKKELTYLSWAWAWAEFKKIYPEANYEIKMFEGKPFIHDEATGYMVFTSVTAEGLTYDMWLPVMNSSNKALKSYEYTYTTRYGSKTVDPATMFDINKTIMRCLTKNLAMFGLGLYIYAGEDLPTKEESEAKQSNKNIKNNGNNGNAVKIEYATFSQKHALREKIGGEKYAEIMNKNGGKLSVSDYERFMSND